MKANITEDTNMHTKFAKVTHCVKFIEVLKRGYMETVSFVFFTFSSTEKERNVFISSQWNS